MRRFNYDNNDDYKEDVDNFFNEDDDDYAEINEAFEALLEEEQMIEHLLANRDLNYKTLRLAIRICEKSFWWWFCFPDTRLKLISKVYEKLRLLEEDVEDDDIEKLPENPEKE